MDVAQGPVPKWCTKCNKTAVQVWLCGDGTTRCISCIWDGMRLGPLEDFIRRLREKPS